MLKPSFSMLFKGEELSEILLIVPRDTDREDGIWMSPEQFLHLVDEIRSVHFADRINDIVTEARYTVDQAAKRKAQS